jgi:cardiolipin synthase
MKNINKGFLAAGTIIFTTAFAGIMNYHSYGNNRPLDRTPVITTYKAAKLLVDGPQIFPEIYRQLDRAKKKIQVSVFLFGGKTGRTIAEKLIKKKKKGVEIEFVADSSMGDLNMMKKAALEQYNFLARNGIEVRIFPSDLLPAGPTFLSNIRQINHTKMVIIDRKTAIIGGMNFLDSEKINHDYMVKITGPAAGAISDIAHLAWLKAGGITTEPPLENPGDLPVSAGKKVEVAQTGFYEQSITDMVVRHIDQARSSVAVEMMLIDDQDIVRALIRAKERGVDVKIIMEKINLNKYFSFHTPFPGINNYPSLIALLKAGVPVRWYVPGYRGRIMHGKIILIDDRTLITGSANLTYGAMVRNHEITITLNEPEIAADFKKVFEKDWNLNSEVATSNGTIKLIGFGMKEIEEWMFQDKDETEYPEE